MLTMDDLYAVLRALDLGHVERLILVGDPNQLPPIGVGRPFADLVGVLDEPASDDERRRGAGARTPHRRGAHGARRAVGRAAARRVVHERAATQGRRSRAQRPRAAASEFNDLEIVTWRRRRSCALRIGEQLQAASRADVARPTSPASTGRSGSTSEGWIPFDDPDGVERFQILSPVRMHAHGVHDLNRWLQRRFRRARAGRRRWATSRSAARTRSSSSATRSATGWVRSGGAKRSTSRTARSGRSRVQGEGRLVRRRVRRAAPASRSATGGSSFGEDGGPLELAYALTVHKAQGSDFGIVFFVLPKTRLLSRELLYTGLTRSKEKLVLLVEGEDASALYDLTLPTRSETARRNTNLFRPSVREDADETPYAEHLIHRLSDGRMVRSKSELAIAIELQRLGMWDRCHYERPLDGTSTGGRLRPDFTFIDAAGDPIIWEHLGHARQGELPRGRGSGSSSGTRRTASSSARTSSRPRTTRPADLIRAS